MPTFEYIAIDSGGSRITGRLTDTDEQSALQRLREMGHYPTEIHPAREGEGATPRLFGRIKPADLTVFSRQLANLVKGGLPLLRAFTALTEHTDNEDLRQVLTEIRSEIESGSTLSEALGGHPEAYPDGPKNLFRNVYRAVEKGQMPDNPDWSTFVDGHKEMAICDAIIQSNREQQWTDVQY